MERGKQDTDEWKEERMKERSGRRREGHRGMEGGENDNEEWKEERMR